MSTAYEEALTIECKLAFLPTDADAYNDRKKLICLRSEKLIEACANLGSDNGDLKKMAGSAFLILQESDWQKGGDFFSYPIFSRNTCNNLHSPETQIQILTFHWEKVLELQRRIIADAMSQHLTGRNYSPTERRHALNTVISSLEKLQSQVTDNAILLIVRLTFAEATFHRGRMVRPKGFAVPEKKRDLFLRALSVFESLSHEEDDRSTRARFFKAWIYLELMRFEANFPIDLKEVIEASLEDPDMADTAIDSNFLRNEFRLALAEQFSLNEFPVELSGSPTALQCARKTAMINWNECPGYIKQAVNELKDEPFFEASWEQIVNLLKKGQPRANSQLRLPEWHGICLELWKITKSKERNTSHGFHLRFYWARQRDIYDLAFHAAGGDLKLKIEIADSLKNRPALSHNLVQQLDDKALEEWCEALYSGRYTTNYQKVAPVQTPSVWPPLPEPWIAVHFYLSNGCVEGEYGNSTGYALIHDENNIIEKTFDYVPLWQAYSNWQQTYLQTTEARENNVHILHCLQKLCQEIGKNLSFLFTKKLFPPRTEKGERPVVFIPHDFLRRIPLHAAIDSRTDKVWSVNHPNATMLNWEDQNQYVTSTGKSVAFADWENPSLIMECLEKMENVQYIKNVPDKNIGSDIGQKLLGLKSPPSYCFLFCHGIAHPANVLQSELKLGTGIRILDIYKMQTENSLPFKGSSVFLRACETDMMPPLSGPMDEHISISAAFLQAGANEVLGGLWEIPEGMESVLNGQLCYTRRDPLDKNLFRIAFMWQATKLNEYHPGNLRALYDGASLHSLINSIHSE